MNAHYSILKTFSSQEEAEAIALILKENGIEPKLGDNLPKVDSHFLGTSTNNQYEIKIKQADFGKAKRILEEEAQKLVNRIDTDYYLYEFTDDELYEILLKPDEWSEFDFLLSQKILKARGKNIDQDLILSLQNQRIKDLSKPEESQTAWVISGYIFAFLGGFIGLVIGYHLWKSKKTLPNGKQTYNYSESDRINGKYIFIIGVIVFPLILLWRVANEI